MYTIIMSWWCLAVLNYIALHLIILHSDWLVKIPLPLSPKSPWMLDKPEVLAEVTEQPRFLPWEFDTTMLVQADYEIRLMIIMTYYESLWSLLNTI